MQREPEVLVEDLQNMLYEFANGYVFHMQTTVSRSLYDQFLTAMWFPDWMEDGFWHNSLLELFDIPVGALLPIA